MMMSRPLYSVTATPTKRSAKSGAVTFPTQATACPPGIEYRLHGFTRWFLVQVVDDDARALACELQGDGAADAAAGAGDQRNLAVECF
jgi:hypothetical protein